MINWRGEYSLIYSVNLAMLLDFLQIAREIGRRTVAGTYGEGKLADAKRRLDEAKVVSKDALA